MLPIQCETCDEIQANPVATIAPCCYCAELTCFKCRSTERHSHNVEQESINYGFCLICGKVQPITSNGKGRCACDVCDFEWAPRAIMSQTTPGQAICAFCGALQLYEQLPFHCGRCSMPLA